MFSGWTRFRCSAWTEIEDNGANILNCAVIRVSLLCQAIQATNFAKYKLHKGTNIGQEIGKKSQRNETRTNKHSHEKPRRKKRFEPTGNEVWRRRTQQVDWLFYYYLIGSFSRKIVRASRWSIRRTSKANHQAAKSERKQVLRRTAEEAANSVHGWSAFYQAIWAVDWKPRKYLFLILIRWVPYAGLPAETEHLDLHLPPKSGCNQAPDWK